MAGAFVRGESSPTLGVADTVDAESAAAASKSEERDDHSPPPYSSVCQDSLMSADTDSRQLLLGWFLLASKLFALPLWHFST